MTDFIEKPTLDMHPIRPLLYDELHSRPFQVIPSPARITYITVLCDEQTRAEQFEHMKQLCRHYGVMPAERDQVCYEADFGYMRVRRERHLEFTTYSFINSDIICCNDPFECNGISALPKDWLNSIPGQVVAAFHIAIEDARRSDQTNEQMLPKVRGYFEGMRLIGSSPQQGDARVWTTFRLHSDGFGRFLIYNRNMSDSQLGRLAQRLMEVETYRLMALLSLPMARQFNPKLMAMDRQLADITERLAQKGEIDEKALLAELTDMAASVESCRAQSTFRFGATKAYHELTMQRLAELREDEVSGHLTVTEFLTRRLTPAVNTCQAASDRLEDLSRRIDRVSDMMRTRVELSIQSQNQQLLESMDNRSKIQLMMQHTVEGLSVAAISYYMIGLLGYIFSAISYAGIPINAKAATGISVPLVLFLVWWATRSIHKRFHALAASDSGQPHH